MKPILVCAPRPLPKHLILPAAELAIRLNPANRPHPVVLSALGPAPTRERIAIVTNKRWHTNGVRLTVGFMWDAPSDLRARIIQQMNAWAKSANVKFTHTDGEAQVRIANLTDPPDMAGYWSYLGTEILNIPKEEPTMNLEGFSMDTPESEFVRVVRHETGLTLGFPHEHLRAELVNLIDPAKAIAYFEATQGWSEGEVRAQVLTPIEESSIIGNAVDAHSIMCYQIPGTITRDGKPILGGLDIDKSDYDFAAACYPKPPGSAL